MCRQVKKSCLLMGILWAMLCLPACHKGIKTKPQPPALFVRTTLIVDDQKNISEPVKALMRLSGLEPVLSLKEAVQITQKSWIRPKGLEHIHLSETRPKLRPLFLKELQALGFMEEVMPQRREYDYVLLLGAMYETYKSRLLFLEELVNRGITFKNVALLGAHRPLEPVYELKPMVNDYIFAKLPVNEIEMMENLYGRSSLRAMVPIKIASPMKIDSSGKPVRANTFDTVVDFVKTNTKPGSVLVISNQPYVVRQGLVVASVLKQPWYIETVGLRPKADIPTDVYLDELARVLYEINK